MASTQRKKTTRAKTTRPRAKKKRQGKGNKSFFMIWLVITLLVIIALLCTIIYLLLDNSTQKRQEVQDYQKPEETITLPNKDLPPKVQQPHKDVFRVSYKLQQEVTAHVSDYVITVYKNGVVFNNIKHSSAPIKSITVDSKSDPVKLKVVAVDRMGDESYTSTYVYELISSGDYILLD